MAVPRHNQACFSNRESNKMLPHVQKAGQEMTSFHLKSQQVISSPEAKRLPKRLAYIEILSGRAAVQSSGVQGGSSGILLSPSKALFHPGSPSQTPLSEHGSSALSPAKSSLLQRMGKAIPGSPPRYACTQHPFQ